MLSVNAPKEVRFFPFPFELLDHVGSICASDRRCGRSMPRPAGLRAVIGHLI